jgi:hypothetical protein
MEVLFGVTAILCIVALVGGLWAEPTKWQDSSDSTVKEVPVSQKTPLPTAVPSFGPGDVATPTFSVYLATYTQLPTLPAGITQFELRASGTTIVIGNRNDIATVGAWLGIQIPAGTSRIFTTATTTPAWWMLASGTNGQGIIDAAW